jgi:hypothetical protein
MICNSAMSPMNGIRRPHFEVVIMNCLCNLLSTSQVLKLACKLRRPHTYITFSGAPPHYVADMFDPLSSTSSIFANGNTDTPPWPTTPHEPNSPIPNLRRVSPSPSSQASVHKPETDGLYGREPKIYGQPEPGLVSPQTTVSSNGTKFEKTGPYLRARITGMDRNRRDILFKLDAQVS